MSDYINKIYYGDTLTILKTLPDCIVDVGITSPPYNKGEDKKGWLVTNVKYSGVTDRVPEEMYQDNQIAVLNEIYRVTKPKGSFFYNHKIRWERGKLLHPMDWLRKTQWTIRQEIIWDRMIAGNIRGWRFWQVEERIYWLYKPEGQNLIGDELKPRHALLTSIWRFAPEQKNPHPAPFPIALPTRAIFSVMDEKKGIVIDPYCGSGTTLVSAKILGHDFIGIEISKEYIAYAEQRIKNYALEVKQVEEEVALHIVEKTFKDRKERGEFTGRYSKRNAMMNNNSEKLRLFSLDEF